MARYTGPKHKIARREGVNILEKESASLQRRLNVPPGGLHGRKMKRRLSEYGQQMREKQKAKAIYGLLEKQFSNLVKMVGRKKGETGEMLISLLETRLDNIVFRLGFAKTRAMARQMVGHGQILVNDKRLNIPSYKVELNDVVTLTPKAQKNPQVLALLEEKDKIIIPFLKRQGTSGKLVRMPKKEDVQVPFDLQLIIEYYSR
ncbi:MAG: 30S ribosomal protein S4 [Candidatus Levybacteria bacterium RIFCSPLOWO2_01_FULL_39_24]|nr:MAG: 30S ribosomal protein S4 [Candidatus Levybacteria bacterium RIFCSPHIGHO2_01_FULL_40_16]OGH28569.1 MAG: 30S ribosomal protein S4 [Candidatus Levybacteria bacterium RIFCSPHIGHO2_12_FULL_39_9]OGH45958.1 MAG: 30S ribosomal protein S4 [Candidatus Levybacteria bacterium RIFCSPLOWO2_01_FULL_39_24]